MKQQEVGMCLETDFKSHTEHSPIRILSAPVSGALFYFITASMSL
jgi:hypothetical protein